MWQSQHHSAFPHRTPARGAMAHWRWLQLSITYLYWWFVVIGQKYSSNGGNHHNIEEYDLVYKHFWPWKALAQFSSIFSQLGRFKRYLGDFKACDASQLAGLQKRDTSRLHCPRGKKNARHRVKLLTPEPKETLQQGNSISGWLIWVKTVESFGWGSGVNPENWQ